MTQLMIDTVTDSVSSLHRVAKFIMDEADARFEEAAVIVPAGTSAEVPQSIKDAISILKQSPIVELPQDTNIDTAAIFAKNKQPAGLDGHGEAPSPPFVPPVLSLVSGAMATAPIAPGAPAWTVTAPGVTVVLDSGGIPHDPRIHQETRKLNKNGTWQNKRGIDKDLLAAVTAELKAAWGKPAAAPTAPASSIPTAPPPPAAPAALVAPPAPPIPGQPPSVPTVAAPGTITGFRELMQKITVNTNAGKLSNEQVDAALGSVGLPARQLIALVNQPALIPSVDAYIDACLVG